MQYFFVHTAVHRIHYMFIALKHSRTHSTVQYWDCFRDKSMNRKSTNCGFGLIIDDLRALFRPQVENDKMDKEAKFVTFVVFTFLATVLLLSIGLGSQLINIRNCFQNKSLQSLKLFEIYFLHNFLRNLVNF